MYLIVSMFKLCRCVYNTPLYTYFTDCKKMCQLQCDINVSYYILLNDIMMKNGLQIIQ